MTRRHHPAEGKSFDVVVGGQKQLVIRLDDESTMRVPRSWTDADGCGVGMDGPERVFSADAIRELGALVALLAHRQSQESASAALNVDRAGHPASDEEV